MLLILLKLPQGDADVQRKKSQRRPDPEIKMEDLKPNYVIASETIGDIDGAVQTSTFSTYQFP